MFDGVLGVVLVIVVIWAAFKLVTRLVVATAVVVLIAVVFFGAHLPDLGWG